MHDLIERLTQWYADALASGGYPLIVLLMAIESSVFPLPSEVVIPPAAHLAYTGKLSLSLWGIVVAGTIGSWIGASAMYWIARIAGRPLLVRYGKYILMPPDKLEGAERWAAAYGTVGIFVSRLLPVVRHLIGIPAGLVRLDYAKFSIFTLLGSAVWCTVLAVLGVVAGQDESLMHGEYQRVTLWLAAIVLGLGVAYYGFVHRHLRSGTK